MGLKEEILKNKFSFQGNFIEQRDKSLYLTSVIAERKVFLSKKTLTYRCRLKINDIEKKIYLFEILEEKGAGLSTGNDDGDFSSPGFGFKVETYNTTKGTRRGSIEEESTLFGKEYTYKFDWNEVKKYISDISSRFGFQVEFVLDERSLQKR